MMTVEKFQQMIADGQPLEGTEMITFMRKQSAETRRLLMDLNTNYHTDEEIVYLFSRITATDVDPSFRMFPPFYTDFGKNIHLGKNVFINSCCQFQDQGGIFIGDNCLIGPGTMLATLNHGFAPGRPPQHDPRAHKDRPGRVDGGSRHSAPGCHHRRQLHHCRRGRGGERRSCRHDCRRSAGQGDKEHPRGCR